MAPLVLRDYAVTVIQILKTFVSYLKVVVNKIIYNYVWLVPLGMFVI